jgi:cytochrome c biogenesis protein CcdA
VSERQLRLLVTTGLDVLGLLLLAAGVGVFAYGVIQTLVTSARGIDHIGAGMGLIVAGLVVLTGSWLADRQERKTQAGDETVGGGR